MRSLALHEMQRASTEATGAYCRMKQATTTAALDRCMQEFMAALKKCDKARAELRAADDAIIRYLREAGG